MAEAEKITLPSRWIHTSAQLMALTQVMAMAEFSVSGNLQHANAKYLALFGIETGQEATLSHRDFCDPEFAASPGYEAFWSTLQQGESHCALVERRRKDGSTCWIEATYTPICDEQGALAHILEVAIDVTDRMQRERGQHLHLRLLSMVAEASDTAVIISDHKARIVYVNDGFTRMFGWGAEEALGKNPIPLLAPEKNEEYAEVFRPDLRIGQSVESEEVVVDKEGQRYWVKNTSNPIFNTEGRWQYTVTMLTDITSSKLYQTVQHRALEAMALEKPLFEVLNLICQEVEHLDPGISASILEVDQDGFLHPLAAPSLPAEYCKAIDGVEIGPNKGSCGTAAWRKETVRVDDMSTDPLWEAYRSLVLPLGLKGCWSTPICNSEGRVIATFAFYFRAPRKTLTERFHQRLIDACAHLCTLALERESARRRIRQLAFYDSVTGLPNRSLLHAKADQAIAACARNKESLAVIFIDLDRFKQVNDSLGHPAGDELLRHVASRLQAESRAMDIAGRLAGDEFVVLLPQCDTDHVTHAVERIQQILAKPIAIAGTSLSITASIGIAMYPADGQTIDALLHGADMAMYQAKNGGRGGYSFFSREMNQLMQERLMLERALSQALNNGQLHLNYQPQIELETGRLYGVEALARWNHPELGPISPARFIPLAEECGLVADLGRWALREACRQLAEWRASGLDIPGVSVNLSPTSFHNLDLPSMIADTLESHSLQSQDLTVEITESILLDTHPSTMKTIEAVRAQGVRLSMDDFGTGYSSLSYLRRLPVTELKLDRSFVADLEQDEAARALSGAILGIGKSLHLTVVAEGVETVTQNQMLLEQGYPVAQGYLFSRPLAPKDLEAWMQNRFPATPHK